MPPIEPKYIFVYSLYCEDLPASVRFYRDVLGLSLLPHHGQRPAFKVGESAHLVIQKGMPPSSTDAAENPFPLLAFAVEDLDAVAGALRQHGVDLPWGIEGNGGKRWVKFYDPGGSLIELAEV